MHAWTAWIRPARLRDLRPASRVSNPFDHDTEVFVTVAVYDGEPHVCEISGSVKPKADSTSVEQDGSDEAVPFTRIRNPPQRMACVGRLLADAGGSGQKVLH